MKEYNKQIAIRMKVLIDCLNKALDEEKYKLASNIIETIYEVRKGFEI